jgi:hypothetical protein
MEITLSKKAILDVHTVPDEMFQDPSQVFTNIHQNIAEGAASILLSFFVIDLFLTRFRFLSFQSTECPAAEAAA